MLTAKQAGAAIFFLVLLGACSSGESNGVRAGAGSGRGSATSDPAAAATCTNAMPSLKTQGFDVQAVLFAEPATAGDIAAWRESSAARAGIQVLAQGPTTSTDPVTFCIFSGTFSTPGPAGRPVPTAASIVLDSEGHGTLVASGAPDGLQADIPPTSTTSTSTSVSTTNTSAPTATSAIAG